ncbi:TD and POZ domain-containing protein 3 [Trichonephila clavipes]|nr:TD and POZ domain-containing protein 3 [Trichonephila clavipes]
MKKRQRIESPVFVVHELENTEWLIYLYPRGCWTKDQIEKWQNPLEIFGGECTRQRSIFGPIFFLISQKEVFVRNKSDYLPLNTLTVRCRIWRRDGEVGVDKYFLAGTRVVVQQRSFQWEIEKFSTIGYNEKKHLVIRSIRNEILMIFDLYFTGGSFGGEVINIAIHVFNPNAKYLSFKTYILDYKGELTNCGMKEFVWEGRKKKTLTLLLSKKQLQSTEHGRAKYLENDVLTLYCECIFSTGIAPETIEYVDSGIASLKTDPLAVLKVRGFSTDDEESEDEHSTDDEESEDEHSTDDEENEGEHSTHDEESEEGISTDEESVVGLHTDDLVSLREDLESLCCREVLSDMKLRTNTNTIPVHTPILGARSSVFRAMFSNNMKERTQGCVDVTDLDDETVRRMLLYMYTNKLEDLHWESASQLYAASDKYDIASLRIKCSVILLGKLSPKNACKILTLADMHQDNMLKRIVQEYIHMRSETIFSSEEWKLLMKANLHLAAETMHLKWNKD